MPSQPLFLPSLRHAILSGRPLVAVETATGELLAAVVEAARAAGREADLRIVLTPEALREETEIAGTTRMDPDWPDDTLPAPVLRADEIDPARSILVAAGMAEHAHPLGGRLAAWMARLAAERGLPTPATLVHDSGETLDEAGQRALYGGHAPVELGYVDLYAPVDVTESFLAVPPIAGEAFAWAVARLEAGAEVVEVDGCVACHGDGRLVVARRLALPTYHDHPARATARQVEFREVGPNGWIRGVTCMEYGCDAVKLALATRLAWRGGLRALRLAEHERHGIVPRTTPLQESGTCLLPDGKAALPPGAMAMISRYTDPALVAAIQGACHEVTGVAVFASVNVDPATRQARRDFAMTYPALSRLLLRPDILACVDAGRETLPTVGACVGGIGIARRLVGVPTLPFPLPGDPYPGPGLLAAIGHDRLPARGDASGWSGYVACAGQLAIDLSLCDLPPADPRAAARLLTGIPGATWAERAAALRSLGPNGTRDYLRSFHRWIQALRPGTDPGATFPLLCGHGNLRRIVEAAARWHALPHLHLDTDLAPDTAWDVPFDVIDLDGGWCLRALSDLRGLVDEGRHGVDPDGIEGLAHCVASYGRRCMMGESLILSLRREVDGAERRVSTVELRPDRIGAWMIGGRRYLIEQHRARGNADPGPEADARLGAGLDRLARLIPNAVPTSGPRAPRASSAIVPADLLDEWRAVMPPDMAGLPAEGILARIAAADAAVRAADGRDATE